MDFCRLQEQSQTAKPSAVWSTPTYLRTRIHGLISRSRATTLLYATWKRPDTPGGFQIGMTISIGIKAKQAEVVPRHSGLRRFWRDRDQFHADGGAPVQRGSIWRRATSPLSPRIT